MLLLVAGSFCEFPQEIGLQFLDGAVSLSQVQLLSHQSKISTRIELFMGVGPDYFNCAFTRLGYLSLDSNERSQFKARELKSVYLKARGSFMKLLLHKCHVNSLNLYNQVGLIAINILGAPVAQPPVHFVPHAPGLPHGGSQYAPQYQGMGGGAGGGAYGAAPGHGQASMIPVYRGGGQQQQQQQSMVGPR